MNTNDAIKVLKENGLKYTDKRKDMLDKIGRAHV